MKYTEIKEMTILINGKEIKVDVEEVFLYENKKYCFEHINESKNSVRLVEIKEKPAQNHNYIAQKYSELNAEKDNLDRNFRELNPEE